MTEGINRLAGVVQERVKELLPKAPIVDFGEIQSDWSLVTNYFPEPIPVTDYLVCRQLTLGKVGQIFAPTTVVSLHSHHALVSEKIRSVKPGDRVLVVWVKDDPCVVDLILPADVLPDQ